MFAMVAQASFYPLV